MLSEHTPLFRRPIPVASRVQSRGQGEGREEGVPEGEKVEAGQEVTMSLPSPGLPGQGVSDQA